MSLMTINRVEAKQLTLAFLYDWMAKLPKAQRTAPAIAFNNKPWKITEMISQVQMNTDTGERYVNSHIRSLKEYIIVG